MTTPLKNNVQMIY